LSLPTRNHQQLGENGGWRGDLRSLQLSRGPIFQRTEPLVLRFETTKPKLQLTVFLFHVGGDFEDAALSGAVRRLHGDPRFCHLGIAFPGLVLGGQHRLVDVVPIGRAFNAKGQQCRGGEDQDRERDEEADIQFRLPHFGLAGFFRAFERPCRG
jgi:hypothetical protein